MLAAALLASSGLLLAADAGTAKAAQCLGHHFSDDFAGETAGRGFAWFDNYTCERCCRGLYQPPEVT